MKNLSAILAIACAAIAATSHSAVIDKIPGPDDQGGMEMPMVTFEGGTLGVMFMPPMNTPILAGLNTWKPGDTFELSAAWYGPLDPVGGDGDLFNNQYGFMFDGIVPDGKSLGIRLTSVSSPDLQFFNYLEDDNLFDEVFTDVNSQVLWNGNMWHNYVTAPATMAPGIYTATFQVFIADATFTDGTGFADYSPAALAAAQDPNYTPVTITYTWEVVPEPSTGLLIVGGAAVLLLRRRSTRLA